MKLLKLRQKKSITQAELASFCHTTQQQIAKIERGLVDPKLTTLRRLAEAFDCELKDLFWTKKEFLKELRKIIVENKMPLKNLDYIALNRIASKERQIQSFHPFWEMLEIKNNQLIFKEN